MLIRLDQAFVDIALVEFGIAHQCDHPAGVGLGELPVRDEIVLHETGEGSDRDAEAYRSGREIDGDDVLRPARIALSTAEPTEAFELVAALIAKQIVDRVEHRPGVRLDRDLVIGSERVEVERCHDRADRCARRLMSADLEAVAAITQMVGIVDRPGREPAQSRVELGYLRDELLIDRLAGNCGDGHDTLLCEELAVTRQMPSSAIFAAKRIP